MRNLSGRLTVHTTREFETRYYREENCSNEKGRFTGVHRGQPVRMFWAGGSRGQRGREYRVHSSRAAQTRDTRSRGFVALINRIAMCSAVQTVRAVIDRRWHGSGGETGRMEIGSCVQSTPAWLEWFHFTLSRTRLTVDRINGDAEERTFSSCSSVPSFFVHLSFFLSFFLIMTCWIWFQIQIYIYIYVHVLSNYRLRYHFTNE